MIDLYLRTLFRLKLVQVAYRIKYLVKRRVVQRFSAWIDRHYESKAVRASNSPLPCFQLAHGIRSHYRGDLEDVLCNRISFLNRRIDFGPTIDWHRQDLNHGTRLWKLNLHYHEFLIDIAQAFINSREPRYINYVQNTIEHWIEHNPIGTPDYGKDNWNSYAISLRLVAWIKIHLLLKPHLDASFQLAFLVCLRKQALFLWDNLELDILGNHIIKIGRP